jgi:hypothetical protein
VMNISYRRQSQSSGLESDDTATTDLASATDKGQRYRKDKERLNAVSELKRNILYGNY